MSGIANNDEVESARGAGSLYVITRDGNGIPYKTINFSNPIYAPTEGLVELVPMKRTSRHENYLNFTLVLDKVNDILIGIPLSPDPKTKELRFQRIVVREDETLDLSIKAQREKWICLKHSYQVENSPNLVGKPKYKVYDKEAEAQTFINNRLIKRKAEQIAEGLVGNQLVEMARNVGLAPERYSALTLQAEVIKYAEKFPKEFMTIWDSPTRQELTVLKKGIATGVISQSPLEGFKYGGLMLGMSEPLAVEFLKNNMMICQTINQLADKTEKDSIRAMSSKKTVPITDEKDAENERLKTEIERLKKQAAELNQLKADEFATLTADKIAEKTDDPEFAALYEEAKSLKVPHYQLKKTKEQLAEAIKAKRAEAEN